MFERLQNTSVKPVIEHLELYMNIKDVGQNMKRALDRWWSNGSFVKTCTRNPFS